MNGELHHFKLYTKLIVLYKVIFVVPKHYTFILVLPNQDQEYADTDQIRSGGNDVFNDLVNVCCAQEDLVSDELKKPTIEKICSDYADHR